MRRFGRMWRQGWRHEQFDVLKFAESGDFCIRNCREGVVSNREKEPQKRRRPQVAATLSTEAKAVLEQWATEDHLTVSRVLERLIWDEQKRRGSQ